MGLPPCTFAHALETVAKSCGSVFADHFMKHLVEKGTPLLSDVERRKATYDMLQPTSPSTQQAELLHGFQEHIYRALKQRLCPLASEHAFNFTGFDSWAKYAPRAGRPLSYWADRLNPPGAPELADRFELLGDAFGGTKASQLFHLQYLTMLELETCPGDWGNNSTGETLSLFRSAWQLSNPSEKYVGRLFDALEFRASSITLSQCIAKALDLPTPGNLKCRYWHDLRPGNSQPYYQKFQAAFGEMRNLFESIAVSPRERRHDFKVVRFWRPSRWLSAAVALKFKDNNDKELVKQYVLQEVAPRIQAITNAQLLLLLDYDAVQKMGRSWLASIGLCNDPIVAAKNEETIDANSNTDMDCLPNVLQSLSVLNPNAPEHKATVSKPRFNVQTPVCDHESSDWTPRLSTEAIDKPLNPLAHATVPEKDISTTKTKEIEPVNESAPDATTAPLISRADMHAARALEDTRPLEFTEVGEQAKNVEPPNTTVEFAAATESAHFVNFVESARATLRNDSIDPMNLPEAGSTDAAAQVLRGLMDWGIPSSVLAELFMKAADLISQSDAKFMLFSTAAPETQGVSAQLGGLSSLPTEQNRDSLSTGQSAPATTSRPVSAAECSCSIPWVIPVSRPTIRTEADAVNNPTPHHSPAYKDAARGQCQADNANDSTDVSGTQQAENTADGTEVTSSDGLYNGDDFWTKAQHFVRRWE